ncbi:hypothetical protein BGZ58_004502 [Dissophora ornata]|nr:hypothetical protein BGZ58_004502 [Dissophora ornata]
MQLRAPLLLERIFEDFFADSPLRLQEEDQWKRQRQQQRKLLNHNTFQLNQAIMRCSESRIGENNSGVDIQCMDSIQAHQSAEKTRRQAKWDAVRMLGVLYALDKTHVGVRSRDVLAPSSQEYSWHSFSSREDYTVSSPVTFFNRAAVSSQASGTTTQAPSTSQTNKLKSFARRVSRRRRLNQRHGEKPVRDRALSAGQLAMYQHQHKSWYDEDIEMRKGSVESFSDEEDVRLLLDDADYTREPSTRRTAPQVESNSSINGASDAARTHTMNMSSTVFSLAAKSTPAREREPLPMPNRIDDSMNRHQQQQQHILNRNDKIAFLTKYTDRMHLRLQALGIKDWGKDDIRRKKTYQLMIQHNDKTGEKDLVEFYLDRYGGSAQPSAEEQQQPQQSTEIGTAPGVLTSAAT